MVLLIASANIANLMLAKGVARRQEIAVRAALGASRGRLVAQVLTESFVLCLIGATVGVGLAYLLIQASIPLLGDTLPSTSSVALDLRVLGFRCRCRGLRLAPRRAPPVVADVVRATVAGPEPGDARLVVARRHATHDRRRRGRSLADAHLRRGAHLQEPAQTAKRRYRRSHRQRDHDVGRSVAGHVSELGARGAVCRAGGRTAAGHPRRRACGGVDRRAAARRPAGRRRQCARHGRRHRFPFQACRSELLRDARHPGPRWPRLHGQRPCRSAARCRRERGARAAARGALRRRRSGADGRPRGAAEHADVRKPRPVRQGRRMSRSSA